MPEPLRVTLPPSTARVPRFGLLRTLLGNPAAEPLLSVARFQSPDPILVTLRRPATNGLAKEPEKTALALSQPVVSVPPPTAVFVTAPLPVSEPIVPVLPRVSNVAPLARFTCELPTIGYDPAAAGPKASVVPLATLMPLVKLLWPLMLMTPPPVRTKGVVDGAVRVIAEPKFKPTESGAIGLAAMLIVGVALLRFRNPLVWGTRKPLVLAVSLMLPVTVRTPVPVSTVAPKALRSPLVLSITRLAMVLLKLARLSVAPPLRVTVAVGAI